LLPLLASLEEAAFVANESVLVMIVDTHPIPLRSTNITERGSISRAELKKQISKYDSLLPHLHIQGLPASKLSPPTGKT